MRLVKSGKIKNALAFYKANAFFIKILNCYTNKIKNNFYDKHRNYCIN